MKNLKLILGVCMLLLPFVGLTAQNNNDDPDESLYLVGAVPEKEGKVVFSREFSIPGMTKQQVYDRMLKWMETRLKENDNAASRIVFQNPEKGVIAGRGEQWLLFRSTALSLDRAWMTYQLTVECKPEFCTVLVEKIRYTYREDERYNADEWINDEFALNKTKTKIIRGVSKWRIKTVDFANDVFKSAALALSVADIEEVAQKKTPERQQQTGPVVITQIATPSVPTAPVEVPAVVSTPIATNNTLKEIAPSQLPDNCIKASEGKIVIAIGKDQFNRSMMTADAGGSIVNIENTPAMMCTLAPDQPYEALEKAQTYTVMFYPTGQDEPSVVLQCEKMNINQTYIPGVPRSYFGKIVKAEIRK